MWFRVWNRSEALRTVQRLPGKPAWMAASARTACGTPSPRSPWTTGWPCMICRTASDRRICGPRDGTTGGSRTLLRPANGMASPDPLRRFHHRGTDVAEEDCPLNQLLAAGSGAAFCEYDFGDIGLHRIVGGDGILFLLRQFGQALGDERLPQLLQRNTNDCLGSVDLPHVHPGKLFHRTAHALHVGESA
jgi:hypothetical protein